MMDIGVVSQGMVVEPHLMEFFFLPHLKKFFSF